jgi:acetyl esterase/lipase
MPMRIAAAAVLLLSLAAAPAGEPLVVDLWAGKPPDDAGIPGVERSFQLQMNGKPYVVGGRPTKWLTNVTAPTLTIYPAPKEKNTGLSMIICPGGGYHNLGWDVEGEEIAAWLNGAGITGILLKYRCPRRPGDVKGEPPLGPLKDAQRAVSLVRSRAAEWNLDPKKIGMVGFSAGGHLVGATATNFEARAYEALDDVDKTSCRPDFGVMLYSGYFQKNGGLSPTIKIPAGIPPLFIAHATDDPISESDHSVTMYTAMKKAGAAAELHIYATGGHGWGVRKVGHPCETWTDRCLEWLRKSGLLP